MRPVTHCLSNTSGHAMILHQSVQSINGNKPPTRIHVQTVNSLNCVCNVWLCHPHSYRSQQDMISPFTMFVCESVVKPQPTNQPTNQLTYTQSTHALPQVKLHSFGLFLELIWETNETRFNVYDGMSTTASRVTEACSCCAVAPQLSSSAASTRQTAPARSPDIHMQLRQALVVHRCMLGR